MTRGPVPGGGHAVGLALVAGPHRAGGPVAPRVEVRNLGDTPLLMLGVLDGSETGTRCPYYLPSVELLEPAGARPVASPGAPEDPLVGPLRAADFVELGPGEHFDPTDGPGRLPLATFANLRPRVAGVYRFRLVLDTACPDPGRWLGRFGQVEDPTVLARLLARVPRTRVEAVCDVEVG